MGTGRGIMYVMCETMTCPADSRLDIADCPVCRWSAVHDEGDPGRFARARYIADADRRRAKAQEASAPRRAPETVNVPDSPSSTAPEPQEPAQARERAFAPKLDLRLKPDEIAFAPRPPAWAVNFGRAALGRPVAEYAPTFAAEEAARLVPGSGPTFAVDRAATLPASVDPNVWIALGMDPAMAARSPGPDELAGYRYARASASVARQVAFT